jgi:5-methylcytosine-specific restriction endonuclease McrA
MQDVAFEFVWRAFALALAVCFGGAVLFLLPAVLDLQAGRTTLGEASSTAWQGLLFLGGVVVLTALMGWLSGKRPSRRGSRRREDRRSRSASEPRPRTRDASYPTTQPTRPISETTYPAYWPELRQLVLDRDKHRCGNCGSTHELHVHHIVPLSLGGTNEMGNLRTLCRSCHERLHPHMRGQTRKPPFPPQA